MAQPTLRMGSSGEVVRRLQAALSRVGFDPGPQDGRFGPLTLAAVRAYQAARGLVVDGVVGPQTWTRLLAETSERPHPRGVSLHVGLNRVDRTQYRGWDGTLKAAEFDARDMYDLAQTQGFESHILLTADATSEALTKAIEAAASKLTGGDLFFITYSGHGGQITDTDGDETDLLDETWVLYDRELLDDELRALWSLFTSGVRILMLSDSCHSGTVARGKAYEALYPPPDSVATPVDESVWSIVQGLVLSSVPTVVRELEKSGYTLPEEGEASSPTVPTSTGTLGTKTLPVTTYRLTQLLAQPLVTLLARGADSPSTPGSPNPKTKNLPLEVQESLHLKNFELYKGIRMEARAKAGEFHADLLLISGCQDNQLSLDGERNGLFTANLLRLWNRGTYLGDYRQFFRRLLQMMPPYQTPNYDRSGSVNEAFDLQGPFSI